MRALGTGLATVNNNYTSYYCHFSHSLQNWNPWLRCIGFLLSSGGPDQCSGMEEVGRCYLKSKVIESPSTPPQGSPWGVKMCLYDAFTAISAPLMLLCSSVPFWGFPGPPPSSPTPQLCAARTSFRHGIGVAAWLAFRVESRRQQYPMGGRLLWGDYAIAWGSQIFF